MKLIADWYTGRNWEGDEVVRPGTNYERCYVGVSQYNTVHIGYYDLNGTEKHYDPESGASFSLEEVDKLIAALEKARDVMRKNERVRLAGLAALHGALRVGSDGKIGVDWVSVGDGRAR